MTKPRFSPGSTSRIFALSIFSVLMIQSLTLAQPAGAVTGRILDHNGNSAIGVKVHLQPTVSDDLSLEERIRVFVAASKETSSLKGVEASAVTQDDGAFALDCAPGIYRIIVTTEAGATLRERLDAPKRDLEIRLPKRDRYFLEASGDDGPLPGCAAFVRLDNQSTQPVDLLEESLDPLLPPVLKLKANGQGRLVVEKFRHGGTPTELVFKHPGYADRWVSSQLLSRDPESPTKVRLEKGRTISGIVLGPSNEPVAGAQVAIDRGRQVARGEPRLPAFDLVTDQRGRFSIDTLGEGQYRLRIFMPGLLPFDRKVAAGSEDLSVQLSEGRTFSGRVIDTMTRQPIPAAKLSAQTWGRTQVTYADDDGSFTLTGLEPVQLEAKGFNGMVQVVADGYSRSVTWSVRPDPTLIRLVRAATVSGTIQTPDGKPVGNAKIVVTERRENASPSIVERLRSRADGTFTTSAVTANASIALSVDHPEWAKTALRLDPLRPAESRTGVEVQLFQPCVVTGRVVDARGQAVAGATIGARDFETNLDPMDFLRSTTTDAEGRFQLLGLPAGGLQLVAVAPGFAPSTRAIQGVLGATLSADFSLTTTFALQGRVVDPAGSPVVGAAIRVVDTSDGLQTFRATTTEDGTFTVRGLGPETVKVRIESEGKRSNHRVKPGQTEAIVLVFD